MKKILILDDEKAIRDLCQKVLTKNNYITETVQDAKEALEILDGTFGLVIIDFNMPGFNGTWLAEQTKGKFNSKIPVIIMTSSINDIDISKKDWKKQSFFI